MHRCPQIVLSILDSAQSASSNAQDNLWATVYAIWDQWEEWTRRTDRGRCRRGGRRGRWGRWRWWWWAWRSRRVRWEGKLRERGVVMRCQNCQHHKAGSARNLQHPIHKEGNMVYLVDVQLQYTASCTHILYILTASWKMWASAIAATWQWENLMGWGKNASCWIWIRWWIHQPSKAQPRELWLKYDRQSSNRQSS